MSLGAYEERIVGESEVEIRCIASSMDLDGPEACSHEIETVELDEPARKEGDRIVLPGIPLDCPECGNPGGFIVNGLAVLGIGDPNV
ncbi:MAG: hypothetical protein ACOCUO_00395 [archaeon]